LKLAGVGPTGQVFGVLAGIAPSGSGIQSAGGIALVVPMVGGTLSWRLPLALDWVTMPNAVACAVVAL